LAWKDELDQIPEADWKLAARRERIIAPLANCDHVTQSEIEQAGEALRLGPAMVFRLLSYIAALVGGRWIRERLLPSPAPGHSGMTEALTWLRSSDRRTLRRRVEAWPQIGRKHCAFNGLYSINARPLYKLKINSERKLPHYTN
jgi:hypothetical protein